MRRESMSPFHPLMNALRMAPSTRTNVTNKTRKTPIERFQSLLLHPRPPSTAKVGHVLFMHHTVLSASKQTACYRKALVDT